MPIKIIPDKTKIDFINKKYYCFILSFALLLGTAFLVTTKGINFGIDFTGGIIIEVKTEGPANLTDMRAALNEGASLQNLGSPNEVMIRLPVSENEEDQAIIVNQAKKTLSEISPGIEFRRTDSVGPQIGSELIETAIIALAAAFSAMLIYIWFRFEWQYGVGAILALLHDSLALIGFYALTQLEFNLSSIAAVLTVIGYSINDSVVIYDRVRENLRKYKKMPLKDLLNLSVNETLSRTIITGGTTLVALLALIFFGGEVLQSFAWGMFFGVLIGTYSSIYIAVIVLLYVDPRPKTQEVTNP